MRPYARAQRIVNALREEFEGSDLVDTTVWAENEDEVRARIQGHFGVEQAVRIGVLLQSAIDGTDWYVDDVEDQSEGVGPRDLLITLRRL